MQKKKTNNIYSKHPLGDDWQKAPNKASSPNDMFKKSTN